MTSAKPPEWDAFLHDAALVSNERTALESFERMSDALGEVAPDAALRERLMRSVASQSRFARFGAAVSRILDVSLEKAQALLSSIDDPSGWSVELPGVSFLWIDGGPSVANAVRGFVRVQPGVSFPEHEHVGNEHVLILQGAYEDTVTGRIWRAGEEPTMDPQSKHGFHVPAGGVDMIKLAVVHEGLLVLGREFGPR